MKIKTIGLPKLDKLTPTLESTIIKATEELGELARAVGKFRGINGEVKQKLPEKEALKEVVKELLDLQQTSATMTFILEEQYGLNLDNLVEEHIQKLVDKGYVNP